MSQRVYVNPEPGYRLPHERQYLLVLRGAQAYKPDSRWKVRLTAAAELVVLLVGMLGILLLLSVVGVQ